MMIKSTRKVQELNKALKILAAYNSRRFKVIVQSKK